MLEKINQGILWAASLRICFPPDCDKYPSLSRDAQRQAESDQVLQKKNGEKAKAVHARDATRKLELEISLVAEGFLRAIGYNLTDLTRRCQLLQLQEGRRDSNGNWVVPSNDGSTSLLRSSSLYQESIARNVDQVVSKEATSQIAHVKALLQ